LSKAILREASFEGLLAAVQVRLALLVHAGIRVALQREDGSEGFEAIP
jgi:hypothetical protein